jgi:hypothetical protein
MYKVVCKDHEAEFDSLDLAMAHAKELNVCVTIIGNGMELIGVFGADSIENGLCPDGIAYDWKKRRA